MTIMGLDLVTLIAALMVAATPILLAATGEMVVEKAGVLNLGVEGMMVTGAVCGIIFSINSGSPLVGFIGAAISSALLALIFGVLTQVFLSNQVATGLALTLFGLGLSALLGQGYVGMKPPLTQKLDLGPLSDLPVIGPILFSHDPVVYIGLALVLAVWWFLNRTRKGMILRAVGENHEAAHALGMRVIAVRLAAIAFGGAMAGLGGAYLSLVRVLQWTDGMTAGAGWIALALVVFASWRAGRVLLGAYLFGGIVALQLRLQGIGVAIPVEYLSMSPYLITIAVLVFMSAGRSRAALGAPGSLGQAFHASR